MAKSDVVDAVEDDVDLGTFKDAHVTCRTFGHAWRLTVNHNAPDTGGAWLMILKCRTCRAERHDVISKVSGTVMHRHYDYPEGYLVPHHRFERTEFRLELIHRSAT